MAPGAVRIRSLRARIRFSSRFPAGKLTSMGKVIERPTEYELHRTGMSAADYFALPEDSPRCELIAGGLWLAPAPNTRHQSASSVLLNALFNHVEANDLGAVFHCPTDVQLSDEDVVQPDILVIGKDHPQFGKPVAALTSPPLLVIEILSPSSRTHDLKRKFALYERSGVPHFWIADPKAKSVTAHSLVNGRYAQVALATSPAEFSAAPFPDLNIPLARVFRMA